MEEKYNTLHQNMQELQELKASLNVLNQCYKRSINRTNIDAMIAFKKQIDTIEAKIQALEAINNRIIGSVVDSD